mmetsp:Transcript_39715/g.60872  ORF Transcript_39715/g.60872 Transcript_39715/m.60872 type:complete len:106 (+) Transcript_39715:595-912(+)
MFGVKRLTCFALDFTRLAPEKSLPSTPQEMEDLLSSISKGLSQFDNSFASKSELCKYRYADDSMFSGTNSLTFRDTIMKKWTIDIRGKNNKKTLRSQHDGTQGGE